MVPLLLLLPLLASSSSSTVLTPQNFAQSIAHGVWFVEHFSPYCRHCRQFEPTWNELVDYFEAMADPPVHLAQVNCALNGDLCKENGVTGYPQMNLYHNGALAGTYDDEREFHLLVDYLNAHAQPTASSQQSLPDSTSSTSTPTSTSTSTSTPTPTPTPTPIPSPTAEHPDTQSTRSEANPSGSVVSLDVQSFDSFLAQGPAFIKFFAPWCGHCKKLAPGWTQLGRRMQHKVNVAEVDCEQHKALCTSQGVTGFPMMFFYAYGVKTEYTGGRSYDQLVSFANKASSPTMQVIDGSQVDRVVRDNNVVYLLLHDDSDHRLVHDMAKASQSLLGSPPVYVSTSPDVWRRYTHTHPSALLLAFKDGDAREPVATLSSPGSQPADVLAAWLYANRFPTSLELSKDVFQQVMYAPHRPLVLIVATPNGQHDAVSRKLREIAQKWRLRSDRAGRTDAREVVFTWMDAGQWAKWIKDMYGVEARRDPEIIVADHERLLYYDADGSGHAIALNSVSVASALDAILAGTARPKHSQNMLERGVHSLNAGFLRMEKWIVAHPYMTALLVLGLICVVVLVLRSLFADERVDWDAEMRHAKGDRLD